MSAPVNSCQQDSEERATLVGESRIAPGRHPGDAGNLARPPARCTRQLERRLLRQVVGHVGGRALLELGEDRWKLRVELGQAEPLPLHLQDVQATLLELLRGEPERGEVGGRRQG